MAALQIIIILLALFTSCTQGNPLSQTGQNVTVQQLYRTLSQLVVKNMQLENSSKDLQEENTGLKAELTECINAKNSYLRHQVIIHQVLNASKAANDDCKKDLAQLSEVNTELDQCKRIPAKFPATCQAWNDAGYTNDGQYMIDPDGPGGVDSFEVECVMNSHYNVPMTVMHHDSEARMDAGPNNIDSAYGNVRNVVYQASISQIIAVINASTMCEQFIKIECYGARVTSYTTWYSRNGTPMYYWGGATPGSAKCACGMTNTCDNPSQVCNCDANDNVWRSDSGLLTDRSTLPVTKMAFGDLGTGEDGFHILGSLRCFNMETEDCS